jgi:hypothetical protein
MEIELVEKKMDSCYFFWWGVKKMIIIAKSKLKNELFCGECERKALLLGGKSV